MEEFRIVITEESENERIDKFVSSLLENISRSYLQKLIKDNQLLVNQLPVKANYRLKASDEVFFLIPKPQELFMEAEDIALDVLYEDLDLIIVNKPKGMVVHPAAGHYSGTLVNALLYHCKDNLSGINGVLRPGIVHRIDKDTTGSIVVCKNDFSHANVAAQLKEHSITRKYRAIVYGIVKEKSGTIEAPIGRHETDRKKMAIAIRTGKPAITHYKVLEQFDKFAYIECELETGRTHQIRVHLSSIGHPLLGDEVYASNRKSPVPLQGQTLHAMTLGLLHPRTKEYLEVSAPLPAYFEELLLLFRRGN